MMKNKYLFFKDGLEFFLYLLVVAILAVIVGASFVFAGDGGMPVQNTAPTNGVTTEWIIAVTAIITTILTGIGLWLNHKRKQK